MPLIQTKFLIRDLFLPDFQMPSKEFWLRKDIILLKPAKNGAIAFVVTKSHGLAEKTRMTISHYLQICSLASRYTPVIEASSTNEIKTTDDIGKSQEILLVSLSTAYSDKQKQKIAPHFDEFLRKTQHLYEEYAPLFETAPFLENATAYYHRARLGTEYGIGQFIDAAISLESLYNEAPNDIAYKIATRASVLLGLTGKNALEVFHEVKKLYTMRNKIVHGQMGRPTFKDIQKIMEYARISIVCFCLLCSRLTIEKKETNQGDR